VSRGNSISSVYKKHWQRVQVWNDRWRHDFKVSISVLNPGEAIILKDANEGINCNNIFLQTVNKDGTSCSDSLAVQFFVAGIDAEVIMALLGLDMIGV
jgi:hypothetical protein